MNEQTFLTFRELEKIFQHKKNLHTNANGIELELTDTFSASACLWDKEPLSISLCVEFQDTDPELSGKLNLRSRADLDRISEADLDEFLGTPLKFYVTGRKTLIKTFDENYTDESIWQ